MSFNWFRRNEKPLLWIAVIFTVLVFALFPSFGSLDEIFGHEGGPTVGSFSVATTGAQQTVTLEDFEVARADLARILRLLGQSEISEEDVWSQIILQADAEGAGLQISDQDLVQHVTGGQGIDHASYQRMVQSVGFGSMRNFENAYRRFLMARFWLEAVGLSRSVLSADEVYSRWKIDNELFEFEAVAFADVAPEDVEDPGDEVLETYFDEMPEFRRVRLFVDPARKDVIFGWLPFDTDLSALPEDAVAALTEPSEAEVSMRFDNVRSARFPDLEELDEATSEQLRNELKVIAYVTAVHGELAAFPELDRQAFLGVVATQGLTVMDPEGLLDPDELEALEPIGDAVLGARLRSLQAGALLYVPPYGEAEGAYVLLVEESADETPLPFADSRDDVLEQWRKEQVAQAAASFREAIQTTTRELAEVKAVIAPIEEAAVAAAEARITADPDLSEEAAEAIRDEELEVAENDILARLGEFESQVFDDVAAEFGITERLTFTGVPRNYRDDPDEDEDAASVERYLKASPLVFQQDVGGITGVLRHGAGQTSYIVLVTGREFPPESAMLSDEEGMKTARDYQARVLGFERVADLAPSAIMESHGLVVAEPEPATADT